MLLPISDDSDHSEPLHHHIRLGFDVDQILIITGILCVPPSHDHHPFPSDSVPRSYERLRTIGMDLYVRGQQVSLESRSVWEGLYL